MSIREDILAGLRAGESGSVGDETPDELLDAYRTEELQTAANWLMSKGHTIAARDLDSYIDGGAR